MKKVETSAKTRKDAIQRALDKLGVELHEVEIEIVDEGSKGFMGIGARDVTVLVSAEHLTDDSRSDSEPENFGNKEPGEAIPSRNRNDSRRGRGGRGGQGRRENQPARSNQRERGNQSGRGNQGGRGNQQRGRGNRSEGSSGSGRDSRPPRRREPRQSNAKTDRPAPKREARPPRKKRATPVDRDAAQSLGQDAASLLSEIIEKMGIDAQVESTLNQDDDILLNVSSEDSAILIGRKGRNLSSMQFLINRIVLTDDNAETVDRIVVDVEGYLDRRIESLEEMARSMAERAKETGRTIRVKPLSPQERRVIHLTLEDDEDIRTYSTGDAAHRRVVIAPAKKNAAKNQDSDDADVEYEDDNGNATDHDDNAVDLDDSGTDDSGTDDNAVDLDDSGTDDSGTDDRGTDDSGADDSGADDSGADNSEHENEPSGSNAT